MRWLRVVGLSLAATLLLCSSQAGAAGQQPDKVKTTAFPVWTLAMDGPRVAYASAGRIYVWNVATGATTVVKGTYSNAKHSVNAAEIAIAGSRVAWIKRQQLGNTEQPQRLYTASVGGSAHRLRRVLGYTNTDCGSGGSQISGLVGAGSVLAVSTWKWDYDGTTSTNRKLNLITPARLRPIAGGANAVASASTDGSHIAVVPLATGSMGPDYCTVTPSGKVAVRSADGKLLKQIATGPVNAVALSGNRLVVQTATATPAFAVYNWTTGTLVQTWPAPRHVYGFGVSGRLAAYSVFARFTGHPVEVHVLDLVTGKDVLLARHGGSLYRDLAIGRRGLVYVVNHLHYPSRSGKSSGKLVFVPMAKLLRLTGS